MQKKERTKAVREDKRKKGRKNDKREIKEKKTFKT